MLLYVCCYVSVLLDCVAIVIDRAAIWVCCYVSALLWDLLLHPAAMLLSVLLYVPCKCVPYNVLL